MGQTVRNPPAVLETRVRFLGCKEPLKKGMATHSSILAWRVPWTEEPGKLQSMGLHRVGYDWATNTFTFPVRWGDSYEGLFCFSEWEVRRGGDWDTKKSTEIHFRLPFSLSRFQSETSRLFSFRQPHLDVDPLGPVILFVSFPSGSPSTWYNW